MHGYTSDSDSEDEYNQGSRGAAAASTTTNDQTKKRKKPKMPPQLRINRIWKRFSNRKFTKALAILPFSPVQLPTVSERANELLREGYERAAEECRRKVVKIIDECRRVNMRYRDPGWDLDWDLKYEKGHCLNSLGRTKFELSMSAMLNPSALVPKAVKRVHEIFEKPTFMEKMSGSEVKQGSLGDCWLMASLSGLANVPDGLQRICVKYDTRIGIYGFVFYRDGEWIYSIIDDKLYLKSPCWDSPSMQRDLLQQIDREDVERVYRKTYQTGSKALFFAQCKDQNETWAPLIEKAYAKAHGDYASLAGGWIGEGLEDLSGGVTTELLASDILDLDGFWENELSRVNEEFLFGCSTGLLDGGYGDRDGISEGHAYVVMEARTLKNGTRLVKLRNPWGKNKKGIWEGAWSDGSKEWTTEVQEELGHTFGGDSVFWISYEDLLRKYQHFDRTRLFREADWRCCQRWIGVEVPWKPQYNEKFHIKLTRESPLVLVLSQLDSRYFKGLTGQYSFRLHFRLHERDRPGAEDYIVRSHGNYLMDRSVSIELPSMLPGNYSVFISVVGERDTGASSVEDVVQRECKRRVENEKLSQVGHAYDLAHSKGVAHLEAVARARKKMEHDKASASRKAERRKLWEQRHINRVIAEKQRNKNKDKMKPRKQEAVDGWKKKAAETKDQNKKLRTEKKEAKRKAREEEEKKKQEEEQKAEKKGDAQATKKEPAEPSAEAGKDNEAQAEDTPVNTPAETPAQTPAEEKTEEAASGTTVSATTSESESPQNTPNSDGSATPAEPADADAGKVSVPAIDASAVAGGLAPSGGSEAKTEAKTTQADSTSSSDTTIASHNCKCACCKTADATTTSTAATAAATTATSTSSSPEPKPKEEDDTPVSGEASLSDFVEPGDSSDSPVSDWEALYSSDDMSRKPRRVAPTPAAPGSSKWREESEDDNEPDPWNAICVVGFRVYSKDEGLELRVVLEGGDLEEGGMGEKGEADLDNAQANAGGERRVLESGKKEKEKKKEEDAGYESDTDDEKRGDKTERKTKKKKSKKNRSDSDDETSEEGSEIRKEKEKADDDFEVITNANGVQVAKTSEHDDKPPEDEKKADSGFSTYPTIVQKGEDALERAGETEPLSAAVAAAANPGAGPTELGGKATGAVSPASD